MTKCTGREGQGREAVRAAAAREADPPANGVAARRLLDDSGQTFTEYVMILGTLTAVIIGVTAIIVPGLGEALAGLVDYMLVYMGSPNS